MVRRSKRALLVLTQLLVRARRLFLLTASLLAFRDVGVGGRRFGRVLQQIVIGDLGGRSIGLLVSVPVGVLAQRRHDHFGLLLRHRHWHRRRVRERWTLVGDGRRRLVGQRPPFVVRLRRLAMFLARPKARDLCR